MKGKKILVSVEGATQKAPIVTKKKQKTTFESITNPLAPSKDCHYMEYLSEEAFRLFPDKNKWRERLMVELYAWGFEDSSLELMQFCMAKKIPYTTFMSWVHKHEDLAKALKEVKLMIACRKRLGVIHRQYEKEMILRDLYKYDPEWAEVDRYHAALKNNDGQAENNIRVFVEAIPPQDSVKLRGT